MTHDGYLPRLLDGLLNELLAGLPAVLIAGPRATGKTTSARRHATTTLRLDLPREAAPVTADPDAVLATLDEPVLLDEWQLAPSVLSAVKRAIDDDSRPGRFLLTGSSRSDALVDSWPATGRVVRVTQWGLTRREIDGDVQAPSVFDLIFDGDVAALRPPLNPPDLTDYVDHALLGGFPDVVLQPTVALQRRWLAGYIDQLVTRDALLMNEHRDPRRLRRYLRALAANTAGIVEHKTVFDAAGISRSTAVAYDGLLDLLMVCDQVPAWSSNRLKQLARMPKRFVVDPSLLIPLLGIDRAATLADGDLLGRLIETFVLAQLRPERETASTTPTFYHLRDHHGRHEVDLVVEAPDGRIIAIEVKATSAPDRSAARHLEWLRDNLDERFVCGIVFHTGPRPFALGDRIRALPIACIWGPRAESDAPTRSVGASADQ